MTLDSVVSFLLCFLGTLALILAWTTYLPVIRLELRPGQPTVRTSEQSTINEATYGNDTRVMSTRAGVLQGIHEGGQGETVAFRLATPPGFEGW